jgi:hypothetical protein
MKARAMIGVLALAATAGCGGTTIDADGDSESTARPDEEWPTRLVTSEGSGPALYLSEGADSPAIGYLSSGVAVRVGRAPGGDRVYVMVDGALKVRGWLSIARVSARVQQKGRVRGTPTYVAPNDLVGVRGSLGDGIMRIEVRPWLGQANAPSLGPFLGEYPMDRLGADEVTGAAAAGPDPGEPRSLPAGQEVPVYDRPNGSVVATLPAVDPPLVVELVSARNEWSAVRVGTGPFLVGYTNVALGTAEALPMREAPPPSSSGGVPERLAAEDTRPLWKVPAGTRLRFDDNVIAVFEAEGYAREMNRYDTGEVDVFVAVDDTVAIRGMLRADDLVAIEGQTPTPDPTPAPTPAPAPAPAGGLEPAAASPSDSGTTAPGGLAPAGSSAGDPGQPVD